MKLQQAFGILYLSALFLFNEGNAQENSSEWEFSGYLKYLHYIYHPKSSNDWFTGQLFHHRLNVKYIHSSQKIVINSSLRTRLFYGEIIKISPGLGQLLSPQSNDYLNLDLLLWENRNSVGHSIIDRLNIEYLGNDFELRLGRQRINWGIHTIWNPNDVFNIYSFTDFDYEERPGSDALLLRYYLNMDSNIEFATKAADSWEEWIAAIKFSHHSGSYDLQLVSGFYQNNWILGGGWAGNLGNFGFKGELNWFNDFSELSQNAFSIASGIDYSFKNGLYSHVGFLYNLLGGNSLTINYLLIDDVSPKNPYPYKWVIYYQLSYNLTPLWSLNSFILYSPVNTHSLFLQSSLSYNLATNWDLDIFSQVWFEKQTQYESPFQGIFLRLKWSF